MSPAEVATTALSSATVHLFNAEWRVRRYGVFSLTDTSTAGRAVEIDLWGRRVRVYANANLSIYSAATCNGRCPFCVERLRPASRGVELSAQHTVEQDDGRYFAALESTLTALRPLDPSVSVTGGEASRDPRLPRILRTLDRFGCRKRTITTNGSGLWDVRETRPMIDWITASRVRHLNVSRAHPDDRQNSRLMGLPDQLEVPALRAIVLRARQDGTRVRLSCVLLRESVSDFAGVLDYLEFARALGVDNVVFRELMHTDPATHARDFVVSYCDRQRVPLDPILRAMSSDNRFTFVRQVVGYYYYVEVWHYRGIDAVFEVADLGQLERSKRVDPGLVHEFVFHPNGKLASTWQPWDGVLGPG